MGTFRDYSVVLPLTPGELARIFKRRRIDENGCWVWTGYRNTDGYGFVVLKGRVWLIHRVSHEAFVGHVLLDKVVHHKCGNRGCFNPDHVEQMDNAENVRKAKRTPATHCRKGHPLSGDNLRRRVVYGKVTWECATCYRRRKAELRRRQRAARDAARLAALSGAANVSDDSPPRRSHNFDVHGTRPDAQGMQACSSTT